MLSSISILPRDISAHSGESASSEHIAQFYENDTALIDTLTGFVGGGLKAGESTIIIATPGHLRSLEQRLVDSEVDLVSAILDDRYFALDAEATLASFMVDGGPDEQRFNLLLTQLLERATVKDRRVRAFGEMVALLWARGETEATVRLEQLWQRACKSRSLSLFCAYPKSGCARGPRASLDDICSAHTRVI
jgi:MEDS: MEthanogen/methylotroph, DcmR Sensory domain